MTSLHGRRCPNCKQVIDEFENPQLDHLGPADGDEWEVAVYGDCPNCGEQLGVHTSAPETDMIREGDDLDDLDLPELYKLAADMSIDGRSSMDPSELREAIRQERRLADYEVAMPATVVVTVRSSDKMSALSRANSQYRGHRLDVRLPDGSETTAHVDKAGSTEDVHEA